MSRKPAVLAGPWRWRAQAAPSTRAEIEALLDQEEADAPARQGERGLKTSWRARWIGAAEAAALLRLDPKLCVVADAIKRLLDISACGASGALGEIAALLKTA